MMLAKLRFYLWWKSQLSDKKREGQGHFAVPASVPRRTDSGGSNEGSSELSEALRKKDRERQERNANRRRMRGGAPAPSASTSRDAKLPGLLGEMVMRDEADDIAALSVFLTL